MTATVTRSPGRPRSEHADRAIQDAAVDLFVEQGFEAMSMEGVAARAGVGKTTIYRRWDSKQDLVLDAVMCHLTAVQDPDTGSIRDDLILLLNAFRQTVRSTPLGRVFPRMVAEVAESSDLGRLYARRVIEPRRRLVRSTLRRAVARGDLPAGTDLELGLELIMGPVILRKLFDKKSGRGSSQGQPERHVDVVLAGLRAAG